MLRLAWYIRPIWFENSIRNRIGRPIWFEIRFERKKNDSQVPNLHGLTDCLGILAWRQPSAYPTLHYNHFRHLQKQECLPSARHPKLGAPAIFFWLFVAFFVVNLVTQWALKCKLRHDFLTITGTLKKHYITQQSALIRVMKKCKEMQHVHYRKQKTGPDKCNVTTNREAETSSIKFISSLIAMKQKNNKYIRPSELVECLDSHVSQMHRWAGAKRGRQSMHSYWVQLSVAYPVIYSTRIYNHVLLFTHLCTVPT